ncbi:MAG: DUF2254 domain-containing protein [Minwuia sp.]|nr:DUF2254 domain-containing protein [Minwuia sp.]
MISKWRWLLLQLSRRLWIRVALFCLLAVGTALASAILDPLVPERLAQRVGADAVGDLLNFLASSMLAVTTFSLSVMVTAYSAAAANGTPRATALLMQDSTSQNVLATFLGTFVYALVGIVAMNAGVYGQSGLVAVYAVTVAVLALIVFTLFRWIEHLSSLGRISDTTTRVERATYAAILDRVGNMALGGRTLKDPDTEIPKDAKPVYTELIGYLRHLAVDHLSAEAEAVEGTIYAAVLPGQFIHPAMPIAYLTGFPDDHDLAPVRDAFEIGRDRSFDQDPRFGLVVLSEIASKALSPAINDSGTAKDVLARAVRLLLIWGQREVSSDDKNPLFPRVWVPELQIADLFNDMFIPIARDGATHVDIHIALQNGLGALFASNHPGLKSEAYRHSELAMERARTALQLDDEIERVERVAENLQETEAFTTDRRPTGMESEQT